jgi:transcriptional regulator with XRE-family HTH domain
MNYKFTTVISNCNFFQILTCFVTSFKFMTQDATWGRRLLVERDRLGYKNMEDFAQAVGVAAKTLYNYANEETQLNIDFMIKFAQLGGDVQYVVTGVRSDNLPDPTFTIESERIIQRVLLRQMEEIMNLLNESIAKGYGNNGS